MKTLLLGCNGMLGQKMRQLLPKDGTVSVLDRPDIDFCRPETVEAALEVHNPELVINCAAHTAVDRCESEEALAMQINGSGPGLLATWAQRHEATLVHISSDYVFAGDRQNPYHEEDATGPRSAYGRSKLAGEQAILTSGLKRFLIVRTSWLYGEGGPNFVETMLRLAAEREELRVVADQIGSPTLTDDLAQAILWLLESGHYGMYHFSNEGACSWHAFATEIIAGAQARDARLKVRRILPIATCEYPLPAPRPAYSLLSKEKYRTATRKTVPSWQDALARYLDWRFGKREGACPDETHRM